MATLYPATNRALRPRVFIDADVLFAGAASPSDYGASLTVLRMAEITLVDALTSEQVITEAERNLAVKMPSALSAFRLLVDRCLTVVPSPTLEQVQPYHGLAHPSDLPILVASVVHDCPWLVSFNVRHYQPGHRAVVVLKPGEFVQRVRYLLARL